MQVTVIELAGRLIGQAEPEASDLVLAALRDDGVRIRLGEGARSVGREPNGEITILVGDDPVVVDEVLLATGRTPNTAELGLEAIGVRVDGRGHVLVDSQMATNVPGILAAGDVTGRLAFTHAAAEMARIAVWYALGVRPRWKFDESTVPWVVFTDPEVAHVGVDEATAPRGSRIAYVPMREVDRARTAAQTRGYVKIIAAPRPGLGHYGGGRVVGATIVASRAGEMIHEPALALRTKMFTGRLGQLSHAYPSWSVAIPQAVAQFFFEFNGRRARPARRTRRR